MEKDARQYELTQNSAEAALGSGSFPVSIAFANMKRYSKELVG